MERLIPPNVRVVDAELDEHPLPPSPEREQSGEDSIQLLYSQPRTSGERAPFVNPPQKGKERENKNK